MVSAFPSASQTMNDVPVSRNDCAELEMLRREGEALARRVLPPALRSDTEPTVGEVEYWEDRVALRLGPHPRSLARFRSDVPPRYGLAQLVYGEDLGWRLNHRLTMLARIVRCCRRGWRRRTGTYDTAAPDGSL
jgi:hypothetical protein